MFSSPLSILSKMYQTKDLDFAEVAHLPASTVDHITKLSANKDGSYMTQFVSDVPVELKTDSDGLDTCEFDGHIIRDGVKLRAEAVSLCNKFADDITKSLNDRFSGNEEIAVLTSLCDFFNPQNMQT